VVQGRGSSLPWAELDETKRETNQSVLHTYSPVLFHMHSRSFAPPILPTTSHHICVPHHITRTWSMHKAPYRMATTPRGTRTKPHNPLPHSLLPHLQNSRINTRSGFRHTPIRAKIPEGAGWPHALNRTSRPACAAPVDPLPLPFSIPSDTIGHVYTCINLIVRIHCLHTSATLPLPQAQQALLLDAHTTQLLVQQLLLLLHGRATGSH
jgi:hypothetical protein